MLEMVMESLSAWWFLLGRPPRRGRHGRHRTHESIVIAEHHIALGATGSHRHDRAEAEKKTLKARV
jgi:hypothetical protein